MKSNNSSPSKITKHIKIAEPCHENWTEMTPDAKGRHCDMCDKVVVDFTDHSKDEIVEHLENADGKTCGRFKSNQIHKPVLSTPTLTKIAASIMAVVGSQMGLQAQEDLQWMGEAIADPIPTQIQAGNAVPMTLKGLVKDIHGIGVANAKVAIHSGTHLLKSVLTDEQGKYKFELQEGSVISNKITVMVHASGYEMKAINDLPLSKNESTLNLTVVEKTERMIMGKVAYTQPIETVQKTEIEKIHTKGEVRVCEPIISTKDQIWEEMGDVSIEEEVEVLKVVQSMQTEPDTVDITKTIENHPAIFYLGGPTLVQEETTINETDITSIKEEIELIPIPIEVNPAPLNLSPYRTINGRFEVQTPQIAEVLKSPEPTDPNPTPENEQNAIETSSPVENGKRIEFTVYPNPTIDFVNIRLEKKGDYNYSVQDLLGKTIYQGFFTGNKIEISFRDQRSGVYLINITNKEGVNQTKKIILER
jgi:hypothetical protein